MTTSKQAVLITSLWLLMIALLTACNPIQVPLITITPQPTIAFPTQRPVEGAPYVLGGVTGKLAVENGCLRFNDSYTPLWPPGFTLDTTEETIRVRNEAGQVIARVGDEVSIDGGMGGTGGLEISFFIDEPLPPGCAPPYWIAGHGVNSMTTYAFTDESVYFIRRPPETSHRVPNDETLSAQLVLTEGCFQVRDPATGTDYVPLWPPDFTLQEEGEEIYIIDGKGKRVAQADESVQLKGGKEVYSTITSELLAGRCTGPFWEVSEVVPATLQISSPHDSQVTLSQPEQSQPTEDLMGPFSPLPTPLPFPTPVPTPAVTRIPIGRPPFIPTPEEGSGGSYTIFYREDNLVKMRDREEPEGRTLVDVHQQTSLFLGQRTANVFRWGAISPKGEQLVLILTDFKSLQELGKRGTPGYHKPGYFLYLFDLATQQLRLLAENAIDPVWSPNSLYVAYRNTETQGLEIIDVTTQESRELLSFAPDTEHAAHWFTWSPDSNSMAVVKTVNDFARVGGVWVIDVQGKQMPYELIEIEMYAAGLKWSPSGNKLLFVSEKGERSTPERPTNLWIVEIENGSKRQLTHNIMLGGGLPTWSPDAQFIAFDGANLLEQVDAQYDLWLVEVEHGGMVRLTDDPPSDLNVTWPVTDGTILFDKDNKEIWELNLITGVTHRLIEQSTNYWFAR